MRRPNIQEPIDQNPVEDYLSNDPEDNLNISILRPTAKFLTESAIRQERLLLTPQMIIVIRYGQMKVLESVNSSFELQNNRQSTSSFLDGNSGTYKKESLLKDALDKAFGRNCRFLFALPISMKQKLIADSLFNLYLTNEVAFRKIQVSDIYGKSIKLGSYRITAWVISNQGRYLCLHVKGLFEDSFIVVDLANFIATFKSLPIRNVKGIVWAGDDRYIAFYNHTQVSIFETQLGDSQTLISPEQIEQIEFSSDKLYIVTINLQLFVYRKTQWVQKESVNIFKRLLFPHQSNTSRVQFYLLTKSKLDLDLNGQFILRFIKVNELIQHLLVYNDGKLWKCTMGENQNSFEQIQDTYYQQLQQRGIENFVVKDMKIQVLARDASRTQINIVRLHEIGNSNFYIHDQILYI